MYALQWYLQVDWNFGHRISDIVYFSFLIVNDLTFVRVGILINTFLILCFQFYFRMESQIDYKQKYKVLKKKLKFLVYVSFQVDWKAYFVNLNTQLFSFYCEKSKSGYLYQAELIPKI